MVASATSHNGLRYLIFSSLFAALVLLIIGVMFLRKIILLMLPLGILSCTSCNNSINRIFGKRTPHEAYADKVEDSPEGKQWLAASKKALASAQIVELPYKQAGYFPPGKPRALALQFTARQGERVNFDISKKAGTAFIIYADLYKLDGTDTSHVLAADTNNSQFGLDIEETGNYILRLQPELYRTGEYNFLATLSPSLGFPVVGNKARTRSFWGDERDGGVRSHEGIDIFAPKLTPAIAAADGYITGVRDGGIGGKTVWLRASGRSIHLYYAHLDQQLVQEGQEVEKGDTLGLIGNTGNAKYTPPHLHFGVYTNRGPIDPFPYVNKAVKEAPGFTPRDLTVYLQPKPVKKSKAATQLSDTTLLIPLAINNGGYIAELPDGTVTQAPVESVKPVKAEKPGIMATDKKRSAASRG
jgi:murein DD-endopeptidase MepM/ murein hydrolase activator NlpD